MLPKVLSVPLIQSSEDGLPDAAPDSSPRQDFLRRSANGMVRVINPLRASVGQLGRKQLNPMDDIIGGDDDSESETDEADRTATLRLSHSRGCQIDGLPFVRLVRSGKPMHHAQAELIRRADAGEFDNTDRTSQAGGPPLAAIQRDVFERDLASYDEWHHCPRNLKAGGNEWTMAAALGCTSNQCSEQCRQLRCAAGVLKPRTIPLLEPKPGFDGEDFSLGRRSVWSEVPTTDVTQHIQDIHACRSVALMDAWHGSYNATHGVLLARLRAGELLLHDAARAEELECLKAINATPPWLRAVVRAEQHLAWAKMVLNNQPQDQLQLPYDVVLTVGNLLTAQQGTATSHLLTTHTVTWRSERWVELCAERQDAEDEILSLAPAICTAVKKIQKVRKREQVVADTGECCTMSLLTVAGMLLCGVLVMVGLWNFAWGYYMVSAHEEVCECQMQAPLEPESDPDNGTSAVQVEDCCPAEVMYACLEMRRSAQWLFWCVTVLALLKAFTGVACHLRSAVADEADGVAARRAAVWNKRWACLGCFQTYAVVSLWMSMFSDDTDECTEEMIDGTRVIIFGPICVALMCCVTIICVQACAAVCE